MLWEWVLFIPLTPIPVICGTGSNDRLYRKKLQWRCWAGNQNTKHSKSISDLLQFLLIGSLYRFAVNMDYWFSGKKKKRTQGAAISLVKHRDWQHFVTASRAMGTDVCSRTTLCHNAEEA